MRGLAGRSQFQYLNNFRENKVHLGRSYPTPYCSTFMKNSFHDESPHKLRRVISFYCSFIIDRHIIAVNDIRLIIYDPKLPDGDISHHIIDLHVISPEVVSSIRSPSFSSGAQLPCPLPAGLTFRRLDTFHFLWKFLLLSHVLFEFFVSVLSSSSI